MTSASAPSGLRIRKIVAGTGALGGLMVLVVALSIVAPTFLTVQNLVNVGVQAAAVAVLALGSTFVIVSGGIDLSVGSVAALSAMVGTWSSAEAGLPGPIALLLGLTTGVVAGLVNGALISYGKSGADLHHARHAVDHHQPGRLDTGQASCGEREHPADLGGPIDRRRQGRLRDRLGQCAGRQPRGHRAGPGHLRCGRALQGIPGTSASRDRGQGFGNGLGSGTIQVVASQPADFDRTKGLDVMTNLLQSHLTLTGVFAENDEMALGAIRALGGRAGTDVHVVGFDGTPDALSAVETGVMAATIAQQPKVLGRIAVEQAIKTAKGNRFSR